MTSFGPARAVVVALFLLFGLPQLARASNGAVDLSATVAPRSITAAHTDWPTPRFVPKGTGFNPYESVLSPSNVGDLEVTWSAQTEGFLYSTPIVVNGVVYVTGQVDLTSAGQVYAYDAGTGKLLWKTKGSGEPPFDLTVAGGKVYVSFLSAHTLRVYDAGSGDPLWSVHGPTQAPTVVDGVVYAADDLHSLWAIDAQTGRKLWVAHAPLGGYGYGLAVANGRVYVGGDDVDGTAPVYAYNAVTGALAWRTDTGGRVLGTPAVVRGTVYVGSTDYVFYALNAKTGRVRWTATTGGDISASPAVANGVVYAGSADGNVYAYDAITGDPLWVAPTGGVISAGQAAIVANGVVYIGSTDHSVHAFDAVTGDQLWSYQTGGNVQRQSVVDGTLYVTSLDAKLYAFRLPADHPS
jgi:outer membrane protein assembly factor BamB